MLAHLSQNQQEEVIESIADKLFLYISSAEDKQYDNNDTEIVTVTVTEVSEANDTDTASAITGTPYKKPKRNYWEINLNTLLLSVEQLRCQAVKLFRLKLVITKYTSH